VVQKLGWQKQYNIGRLWLVFYRLKLAPPNFGHDRGSGAKVNITKPGTTAKVTATIYGFIDYIIGLWKGSVLDGTFWD